MSMEMKFPAVEKACEHVLHLVTVARKRRQYRLPSIGALARDAGVSRMSMAKALARLKAEGVVTAVRGQGTRVCPPEGEEPSSPQPGPEGHRSLSEAACQEIRQDLFGGRFGPEGALPPLAALSERYGVSTGVLRRVLRTLVTEGFLIRNRRQYRLPTYSHQPNATVVLLARADESGHLMLNWASQRYLGLLASDCSRYEVGLRSFPLRFSRARSLESIDTVWEAVDRLHQRLPVLGYVIHTMGLLDSVNTLLEKLVPMRVPVSILGAVPHHGDITLANVPLRVRWFSECSDFEAGFRVGMYLRTLGHQRIAYLSSLHGSQWSQQRLAGLMHAFADTQSPNCVSSYTTAQATVSYDYVRGDSEAVEALRQGLLSADGPANMRRAVARLCRCVPETLAAEREGAILCRLQRGALKDTARTAWVAASDPMGASCLDFLARKGIDIPSRMSVVAFDDSTEAFVRGLTSFRFGLDSAVHMAVKHILQPHLVPRRSTQHLRAEGNLMVRGSSGPARSQPCGMTDAP